ncbi:MAG: hypothetical protein JXA21_29670 [Anaerolineae bacterium]|nr:hypothetical protein [Anaerolineae bacterium]
MILGLISLGLLGWLMVAAVGRSLESGEWEGFLTFGRGTESFKPCGSREVWWVRSSGFSTIIDQLKEQYDQVAATPYDLVFVRISGDVSKKGQFGPLGSYQRVVYIKEIHEVRERQDSDCRKRKG